jgi:hypothetical protein
VRRSVKVCDRQSSGDRHGPGRGPEGQDEHQHPEGATRSDQDDEGGGLQREDPCHHRVARQVTFEEGQNYPAKDLRRSYEAGQSGGRTEPVALFGEVGDQMYVHRGLGERP